MSGADDIGGVADIQGLAHVVVSDQYADAALFQMANDAFDVIHGNRVNPGERLIQQDEIRVGGQPAGNFGAAYPGGLFLAQDGDNAPAAQNFKLVRWDRIAAALGL